MASVFKKGQTNLKLKIVSENKVLLPGVTALIFTPSLHRDATYFPDPDRFRPERFLNEKDDLKNPFAYIPFSAGPRNCMGKVLYLQILFRRAWLHFFIFNFRSQIRHDGSEIGSLRGP